MWRASSTPGIDAGSRRGWVLFALAHGCVWFGDVAWFVYADLLGRDPEFSPASIGFAVFYPLIVAGALSFPRLAERPAARLFWLDAAAVMVGGGMVSYEALGFRAGDDPKALLYAAYSVGDLALLFVFAVLLLRQDTSERRPSFLLLAFSVILTLLGDLLYGLERAIGGQDLGLPDAAFMLSWACVGVAAQLYRRLGAEPPRPSPAQTYRPEAALVPYAAFALGYGVVLLAALQGRPEPGLVAGAAVLTALVLLRQFESARENARLAREQTSLREKARFEALVESAADVLALVDAEGRFKYLSGSVRAVLGHTPSELIGVDVFDIMHPDDTASARQTLADCLARPGVLQHAAFRFRHVDGGWRDIEADGLNHLDDPEIGAITATFRDVTTRNKAEAELRGQKDLLSNLLAVARATVESPSLEVTLKNALGVMKRLVGADAGSIFLIDERGVVHSSVFAELEALPEAMHRNHAERVVKDGLAGWVARHREAVIVPDVARDPRWVPVAGENVRAAMSVPIVAGDALVGVLTFVDCRQGFFEASHLRFAQDACEQIALALRNAQVFDSLGRMAHRQRLLNEFVRTAGLRLDPDAVVGAALETIARRTHWLNVAFCVPDAQGRVLRIRAMPEDQVPATPQRVDQGIAGRAFSSGKTQFVPDVMHDPDYIAASPEVRSELAVPLKRGDRVLGVLNLESDELDGFDEEDLRLAEALADTVALSLDDALTYRRLADESERLQAVIRASRDGILLLAADESVSLINEPALRLLGLRGLPQDWLGRAAAAIDGMPPLKHGEGELSARGLVVRFLVRPVATGHAEGRLVVLRDVTEERRLETLREDLTHTLVHDLRTPLNSIMGFLEIVGQAPSLRDPYQELLDIAGRATERLVSLIDTILDVGRLEKGVMPLLREAVAVAPLVSEVLALLQPVGRQRGIALAAALPPDLPLVSADPGLLRRIVENLLANALRHTPRGGTVRVTAVRHAGAPAALEIQVSDTGRGVPVEEQLGIFEKYVTGRDPQRGTGLGLAFCRLAVEAQGGRIRVESAPGEGATFAFSLPLA